MEAAGNSIRQRFTDTLWEASPTPMERTLKRVQLDLLRKFAESSASETPPTVDGGPPAFAQIDYIQGY